MTKKADLIKAHAIRTLPRVFQKSDLQILLNDLEKEWEFSSSTKYKVQSQAKKLAVNWRKEPKVSLMSFFKEVDLLEVVSGLTITEANFYVSNYSALYWNELVEQRPENYYLSKESKSRTSIHSAEYNDDLVKMTFMKSQRHTEYGFKYRKSEIFLIEKQSLNHIGVEEKTVSISNREVKFRLTNIERSLLDSIMSPNYSGGILTVIKAFERAEINLNFLLEIYKTYQPFYPYWQSIGFILENTKNNHISESWSQAVNLPMRDFYIDRNYRKDWQYSKKWKLYYPKGVFND